ncbi:hypothetical protein ACFL0W_04455 [Nanoarchaeota archaeon]
MTKNTKLVVDEKKLIKLAENIRDHELKHKKCLEAEKRAEERLDLKEEKRKHLEAIEETKKQLGWTKKAQKIDKEVEKLIEEIHEAHDSKEIFEKHQEKLLLKPAFYLENILKHLDKELKERLKLEQDRDKEGDREKRKKLIEKEEAQTHKILKFEHIAIQLAEKLKKETPGKGGLGSGLGKTPVVFLIIIAVAATALYCGGQGDEGGGEGTIEVQFKASFKDCIVSFSPGSIQALNFNDLGRGNYYSCDEDRTIKKTFTGGYSTSLDDYEITIFPEGDSFTVETTTDFHNIDSSIFTAPKEDDLIDFTTITNYEEAIANIKYEKMGLNGIWRNWGLDYCSLLTTTSDSRGYPDNAKWFSETGSFDNPTPEVRSTSHGSLKYFPTKCYSPDSPEVYGTLSVSGENIVILMFKNLDLTEDNPDNAQERRIQIFTISAAQTIPEANEEQAAE